MSLHEDAISLANTLAYPAALNAGIRAVASLGVTGVVVCVHWGIVESDKPHSYDWSGYRGLLSLLHGLGLKVKVVFNFSGHGRLGLPSWVMDVGRTTPDIFFTDRAGTRNTDCLTIGVDDVRVLRGRTALQAYADFMASFRDEFGGLLGHLITEATVGAPLRFTSFTPESEKGCMLAMPGKHFDEPLLQYTTFPHYSLVPGLIPLALLC